MVRHWWKVRGQAPHWKKGLCLNGLGLGLTAFILVMVTWVKFFEGGWVTLLITGALAAGAVCVNRHYRQVGARIKKLDVLRAVIDPENPYTPPIPRNPVQTAEPDTTAPTAVIFVSGFNGLGVHTLLSVLRLFGKDMDIRLDGRLDGIETAKLLHQADDVPVIFVTAFIDDQTRRRAAETGPLAFVAKPLDEIDLGRLLQLLPEKRPD